MKHLKNFNLITELDTNTYINAANKLNLMGHEIRSKNILSHAYKTSSTDISRSLFKDLSDDRIFAHYFELFGDKYKITNSSFYYYDDFDEYDLEVLFKSVNGNTYHSITTNVAINWHETIKWVLYYNNNISNDLKDFKFSSRIDAVQFLKFINEEYSDKEDFIKLVKNIRINDLYRH